MNSTGDDQAARRVGSVLNGKWTLERLIGIGGMAAVYAARHRNGARAAVKILHSGLARHRQLRERFQREGYAANKVGHPGVVKVLDDETISTGPAAGTTYLVMELLEGESLQDALERGVSFGERQFLELAAEVLDVLQAAHERGVVHRDVKPENLFFAHEDGEPGKTRVKVLDFGLARLLDAQAITSYGLALGTPSFMSPEQAAGRIDEIDGRTDLFSLAATGFCLRAGRRVHEADSPVELVTKMARLPAPRLATVVPQVDARFARIIDRALEFRREDRYETAARMRDDVVVALERLGGSARPPRCSSAPPPAALLPRTARARPDARPAEVTIEVSERDLEARPQYGMDESIRIPKRRSILPWLALLLVGSGAAVLAVDAGRRARVVATLEAWREYLLPPATTTPGPMATPEASATGAPHPTAEASASAPPRPAASKAGTHKASRPPVNP